MTRTDILNALIRKCGYTSYLEIGVQYGHNFNAIDIPIKVGVDPKPLIESPDVCQLTSDDFFEAFKSPESLYQIPCTSFDLIFIDGLHHADQVLRDFENSLKVLSHHGTIVLHDCNPPSELHQRVPRPPRWETREWNGDVWKAWVEIRNEYDAFCVDTDFGVGIVTLNDKLAHHGAFTSNRKSKVFVPDTNYQVLEARRDELLNLITPSQFREIVGSI